jgi:endonuclease IV
MKKEYIDFDLDDYNTKRDLEKGYKIWSDPDEDIVGRYYNINYLKASSMDELIDVTYDSLEKISDETNFYRIYKFCVEFYPSHLYAKIYTIFNTYWDWEKYHFDEDDADEDGQDRLEYSEMEIDKSIEWLNETFYEEVDEIIPDFSKKRKDQRLMGTHWEGINYLLKDQKEIFHDINENIGFDQIYKIENEFYTRYVTQFDEKRLTDFCRFFFIFKNDCDNGYNEDQVKKNLYDFSQMFPD